MLLKQNTIPRSFLPAQDRWPESHFHCSANLVFGSSSETLLLVIPYILCVSRYNVHYRFYGNFNLANSLFFKSKNWGTEWRRGLVCCGGFEDWNIMRIWITGDNKAQCDLIVIELWADSCSQWNSENNIECALACIFSSMPMRKIHLIHRNHLKW